jgi:hypothetical protein
MKQRFFEFLSDQTFTSGDPYSQLPAFIDASDIFAIKILDNGPHSGTREWGVVIEAPDSPQGVNGFVNPATFDIKDEALVEAQLWINRAADLRAGTFFDFQSDSYNGSTPGILTKVNVKKLGAVGVVIQRTTGQPINGVTQYSFQWAVGMSSTSGNNLVSASQVGLKFFADEASALVEAQLWRDRAEATK